VPMRSQRATSAPASLTFGLLPCLYDHRVHAVYDVTDPYPEPVCGLPILAGIWLPGALGPVLLCRRCLVGLSNPVGVELRPAAAIRQRYLATQPEYRAWAPLVLVRRQAARRYDRRILRAVEAEWWR
jgi:hypothetical protein